jgi:hypothetical protein
MIASRTFESRRGEVSPAEPAILIVLRRLG